MYFNSIPKIQYDSMNTGNPKIVTNLLRRVAVRAKIKTNTLLFDTYDVKEGETPEIIAHKLYGDPELHWIVLLVNDVTDRYHQWPMTYAQFLQFVADKYDNVNGTHHYELAQSSGDTTTKIEVYNNSALYSGDDDFYNNATAITNIEYEETQQDIKRKIRLLDPRYIEDFVEEYINLMNETSI
jgi:hypothetical protein|tara:strand:+ start:355 stop:903 length:549 start_codon:yes stop_codon:yes gene_type:complete